MHFLPLLYKRVELGNTAESQLVHQIDLIGLLQELVLECLDNHRESCREEQDLAIRCAEANQLLDNRLEFWREKLVCLIHDKCLALREIGYASSSKIQDTTRRRNQNVDYRNN